MTSNFRLPTLPAPNRLTALAHCLMGAGWLAASAGVAAQGTVPTVTLREVTVSGEAEVAGGLQKP